MLEELDRVDFAAVQGHFGPAEQLPRVLHELLGTNPFARACAFEVLYETVLYQGDPSPVAPVIAPFLLELLRNESVPERHRLATLLGDLARAPGTEPITSVVTLAFEDAAPWLLDPSGSLRAATAYLLGGLGKKVTHRIQGVLAAAKQERDPLAVASRSLCLAAWGTLEDPAIVNNAEPQARAARTISFLQVRPNSFPEAPWEELLVEAATLPREKGDVLRASDASLEFGWGRGIWTQLVTSTLASLASVDPPRALSVARRALEIRHARGEQLPEPAAPDLAVVERLLSPISSGASEGPPNTDKTRERHPPIVDPRQIDETSSLIVLVDFANWLARWSTRAPSPGTRWESALLRDFLVRHFPEDVEQDDDETGDRS